MNTKTTTCSQCRRAVAEEMTRIVDDKRICRRCLYGDAEPLLIYPIGVVRNDVDREEEGFAVKGQKGVSRIELLPSQKRFMHRIGEEKHLSVVWALHKQQRIRSVFTRGMDGKEVGVFASRTPDRLTPIAVTEVELERVEGTTLYVRGLDAVNGSPVLDIKLGWRAMHDEGDRA